MARTHGYWVQSYSVSGASFEINEKLNELEHAYDSVCTAIASHTYKRDSIYGTKEQVKAEDKAKLNAVITQIDECVTFFKNEIIKCDVILEIMPYVKTKVSSAAELVRSGLQLVSENFVMDGFVPGQDNGKEIGPALSNAEGKIDEIVTITNDKKEELNQGIEQANNLKEVVQNKINSIG